MNVLLFAMFVRHLSLLLCAVLLAFGQWPLLASAAAPPANLPASAVTLGWNPSPDPNATGYLLLFGTTSGAYTNQLAVGNTNRATVTGLIPNVVYYFSVVAYDASGQQSPPSNEVSYSPPSAVISLLVTNVLLSADRHGRALMPDITGTNFALAIDTCSGSGVLTQSVAAGAVLALGTNRVVLTLIDGCGNVACATNFVIVEDITPPVLEGLSPAAVNYQYRQDVPPVPTVTATDGCGNTASVSYETHIDNTPPTIQILTQSGGVLMLTWGAIAGQKFQVQYQTNWLQTGWINLGDPISATNATMTASDTIGPDPQRFYRVLIVP